MNRFPRQQGFNLIELMVVIAIVAIIAAIAMPSYRDSVMKSNRSDGFAMLNEIMQAQERYAAGAGNGSYTDNLEDLGYAATQESPEGFYDVGAGACADGSPLTACVLLTATAKNGQENDNNGNGGDISLNSRGEKVGWESQ